MSERRNPEALHAAAAGWRAMGKHLDGMVRELDRHVGTAAAANWHGPAGEAFAAEWHRLKGAVDESLPAFELAAADLETAAAQPDGGGDGHDGQDGENGQNGQGGPDSSQGHGAPPARDPGGSSSTPSGSSAAYGFMALGQLANGLGAALGRNGGKGGGQSQAPLVRHRWDTSTAAPGPDPFGPVQPGEARTRGGEGIAKGVRTQPAGPETPEQPEGPSEPEGAGKPESPEAADGPGKPAQGAGPTAPDTTRHGAFG
ncbi:UmuC protein [Streptomyces sp. NBRC 110611]|uniref:WXG100 family type VII secretion target n=1 Tax=Streptomyces sp. NBRC 110611 TaxID=1621259 RepID=UPI000831D393|nr:WXG100 family type VII secretion target [Streptomyces sp. NBRC 110611]GAU70018.1 UmuC protein [Streptomyces sp. NBRC 110611]